VHLHPCRDPVLLLSNFDRPFVFSYVAVSRSAYTAANAYSLEETNGRNGRASE
jgi:hypothetical protein